MREPLSRESLEQFLLRDHDRVGELGRTLILDHGVRTPRAALLLHGMSATPTQFAQLAQALYDRGYNVLVPRLPRHGHADRLSNALAHLTASDLKAFAAESLAITRGLGDQVVVAGFSLGGLMAAWLAQYESVERVVAIVPYLGIALVPSMFSGPAAEIALRLPNLFGWWDPIAREQQQPAHGYPRYSSHALAHAYRLARELLDEAREREPAARQIVVVNNAREAAVNNRAIARLVRRWRVHRGEDVRTFTFEGLRLSHDIVEPLKNRGIAAKVFPILLDLIDA